MTRVKLNKQKEQITRLRHALCDAEYTATVWESKCRELQTKLEFIRKCSVLNGEDVSFLLAKQALHDLSLSYGEVESYGGSDE
jgi:hypothetical protein